MVDIYDDISFVEFLEGYVLKNNWTNRHLCELTGLSEATISRYFSKERFPKSATKKKILESLGLDDKDLNIDVKVLTEKNKNLVYKDLKHRVQMAQNILTSEQKIDLIAILSK